MQIVVAEIIDDGTDYTVPSQELLFFVFYFKYLTSQKSFK
jgi:hypothetical protein